MHENPRDARLQEILVAYLEAVESGLAPNEDEWVEQHPEFASELRELFDAQSAVRKLAGPLHPDRVISLAAGSATLALRDECSTQSFENHGKTLRKTPDNLGKVRYFGDYELLQEVARGGMGVVYRARQSGLSRIVALKMILAGRLAGDEDVRRFRAEAEAAASLDHPGIVPVFEVGEHEEQHYFSMGFVEGESLGDRLRDGPLPPQIAASLARQMAEAIAYAHSKGVIHRDLKPANIMLSLRRDEHRSQGNASRVTNEPSVPRRNGAETCPWIAKITDFGLAKRLTGDDGLTATGQILGTPSFMPPEQASGRIDRVTASSDVYSLGAILYAMLTARPPFQADNPLDTLTQVIEAEPVAPRHLNPKIPPDLETICLKCLEKEPSRRYLAASALADDLSRFLHDEPILARPLGPTERAWRWLRKQSRSVALATGATAATLAAALLSVALWYGYTQWRLAYLSLGTDRPPLVVEILNDQEKRVAPTRTLPTSEPIALPAGEYQMRITGEARLSQTYGVSVPRGIETNLELNLEDQTLFPTFELERSYDLVPVAGQTRIVLLTDEGVSCRDATTLKELWSTPLGEPTKSDVSANSSNTAFPSGFRWPWTRADGNNNQNDGYDKFDLRPQFVGSRRDVLPRVWSSSPAPSMSLDLNGDDFDDLVLAAHHQAWLLALDGKSGRQLWLAVRGSDVAGALDANLPAFLDPVQSAVVGLPQRAGDLNNDGVTDFIATFLERTNTGGFPSTGVTAATRWVEAVSGRDGSTLWRFDLPDDGFQLPAPREPHYRFRLFTATMGWSSSGSNGHVMDGEAVRPLRNRGRYMRTGEYVYLPDVAQFVPPVLRSERGEGKNQTAFSGVVVLAGRNLITLDSKTGRPLAPSADTGLHPLRSLVLCDLTGDGSPEAIVLGKKSVSTDNNPGGSDCELAVYALNPVKTLWQRSQAANYWDAPFPQIPALAWPLCADLDADGAHEILLPCDMATSQNYSGESAPTGALEVVDGATGKRRWSRRLRTLDEQLDHFAVGPDVNGDGHREVYVATLLYGHTELFVDCLSGAEGRTLWWANRPLEDKTPYSIEYWLAAMSWWETSGDGWPQLLVSIQPERNSSSTEPAGYVFSSGTGRLLSFARNLNDVHQADVDGDGHDELITFRPWLGRDRGGRLDAHRHSPETWRRLGGEDWRVVGDLDLDGTADLVHIEGGNSVVAVSGGSGRTLWRQNSLAPRSSIQVMAFPELADLNQDGAPDLFVTPSGQMNSFSKTRPFHLLSGRTGARLWSAEIEVKHVIGPMQHIAARDLDNDGRPEVMLIAKMDWDWDLVSANYSGEGNYWLTALSGSTGAVRWKTPLEGVAADGTLTLNTVTPARTVNANEIRVAYGDLNHDGVQDVLLPAEIRGEVQRFEIRAVNGKTGDTLWSRPLSSAGGNASEWIVTAPRIGDLDGDKRNEAIVLEFFDPTPTVVGDGLAILTTLEGVSGQPRWRWELPRYVNTFQHYDEASLARRPTPHLLRVAEQSQPVVCINFGGLLQAQPLAEEGPLDASVANAPLVAVLNHQGRPLSRIPVNGVNQFSMISLNADGDGSDEIALLSKQEGLRVIRPGAKNHELWRRDTSGEETNEILGVVRAVEPELATLLVRQTGQIYAYSTKDGAVRWSTTAPRPRLGRTSQNIQDLPLVTPVGGAALAQPIAQGVPMVAYRYGQITVAARASREEAATPEISPSETPSRVRSDPRLTRSLPWMRGENFRSSSEIIKMAHMYAMMTVYGAALVFLPVMYLNGLVRRRALTLRMLLLAPALVGIIIVVLSMPTSTEVWGPQMRWWTKVAAGVLMLPPILLVHSTILWLSRGEWRKPLWWLAGSVAVAVVLAGVMIVADLLRAPVRLPYAWRGWYWIWFTGAYLTGWLLLPAWGKDALAWLFRRRRQDASLAQS
jgi:serine/threonine protein kinase/outer membrane protein assembly factor BamB